MAVIHLLISLFQSPIPLPKLLPLRLLSTSQTLAPTVNSSQKSASAAWTMACASAVVNLAIWSPTARETTCLAHLKVEQSLLLPLQVLTLEALEPLQSRNPSRFGFIPIPYTLIFFLSHLSLTSFLTFHFLSTPLPEPLPHLFALYLCFLLFAIPLLLHLFRFSSDKNSFSTSYTTSDISFSFSVYL